MKGISGWAFANCNSLAAINVSHDNTSYKDIYGVLYSKDEKILINYPREKVEDSYTVPNSVETICDAAFEGCHSLESVTIGRSVTAIGDRAFFGCDRLENIAMPDSVTSIGVLAFAQCYSLEGIAISDSIMAIGSRAFEYCENLRSVTFLGSRPTVLGGEYQIAFMGCYKLTLYVPAGDSSWNGIENHPYISRVVRVSRLCDPGDVSAEAFEAINAAVVNLPTKINADSMSSGGNSVDVRITLDPAKVTGGLNLSASTSGTTVQARKSLFEKWFDNNLQMISLGQKGGFGQPVEIAVQADLTKIDITDLHFYNYDAVKNTYARIWNPNCRVDKNGYLHFTTTLAGDIIISDGPLVKR